MPTPFLVQNILFFDYFGRIIALKRFDEAIAKLGGQPGASSKCWAEAFGKLEKLIGAPTEVRRVVFLDELPWLDAPKSDFLPALDRFWNTFASARPDIMLIVSGSATSWIVKNLFESRKLYGFRRYPLLFESVRKESRAYAKC